MPRTRSFFLGSPPFQMLAMHLVQDEDFQTDSRRILEMNRDVYLRLAARLKAANAFLDRAALIDLTREVIKDESTAKDIALILYKVGSVLHDAGIPVADAMDELAKSINEKAQGLDPQDRHVLADRFRTLVVEPVGLAKQFKARQLVEATGAELDEVRLICDIRPIFDADRECIQGAIPLTVLRLEYELPDGETTVAEMRVTEAQLGELRKKIDQAKRKLKAIKELLASQQVVVPRTKATLTEEESHG